MTIEGPYALLGDHSRLGILTVDARFVGTQARLARSIRYVANARSIAPHIFSSHPSATTASDDPRSGVPPQNARSRQ